MILQVLAVYDSKARAFGMPFFSAHVDLGVRAFTEAANTPDHPMCKYAEDFTLFYLGTFDDQSAVFKLVPQYGNLGLASQFKKEHNHVRQVAQESVRDEARLLAGTEGGNPA